MALSLAQVHTASGWLVPALDRSALLLLCQTTACLLSLLHFTDEETGPEPRARFVHGHPGSKLQTQALLGPSTQCSFPPPGWVAANPSGWLNAHLENTKTCVTFCAALTLWWTPPLPCLIRRDNAQDVAFSLSTGVTVKVSNYCVSFNHSGIGTLQRT